MMLGVMLLTTTVASVAAQPFTPHTDVTAAKGTIVVADREYPVEFDRLSIGKGSELVFYAMLGVPEKESDSGKDIPRDALIRYGGSDATLGGRLHGIGVARLIPAGGMDPMTVPELRDASPYDLYHAFSERGSDIPEILREYGKNRRLRYAQGWALDVVKPNVYNIFGCLITEQTVANAVSATGLPYSYNALSAGPHNSPFWYPEDPNAIFPTYYQNNGLATVGDAYFHVMLCEEDPMFAQTGVNVRLAYEETDDGVLLSEGELNWTLHNIGDQMSFMSWPFDSDLSGDNTWFWMLTVSSVHYNDTLHIGTAWS